MDIEFENEPSFERSMKVRIAFLFTILYPTTKDTDWLRRASCKIFTYRRRLEEAAENYARKINDRRAQFK
jgi:hypothetical protein